jgi:hypothetical protein
VFGDHLDQGGGVRREGEPDRVLHPLAGEPLHELVAVPGTIDPDEHPFPRPVVGQARHLPEGFLEDGDVVGSGVRAGVAGPEQDGEGLPGPVGVVVGEGAQRVESVALLERRFGVLLVRVRCHQGGVDVDDQRLLHGFDASREGSLCQEVTKLPGHDTPAPSAVGAVLSELSESLQAGRRDPVTSLDRCSARASRASGAGRRIW